jgi:hypothetical protein
MSGTLNANYVQSDVGTNLYLNTGLSSGNVVVSNTVSLTANTIVANTVTTGNVTVTGTTTTGNVTVSNTATMNKITDTLGNTFAPASGVMKNRIINGAMVIDQRNGGASVNNGAALATYAVDRWKYYGTSASKFTIQQNAGSVTPPVGYINYLGFTSSAATVVGTSDIYTFGQVIEGYNTADLRWGTANAKTVTLSFWVYSSLTGTFSGSFGNSTANRCYPFTYTISSANTWTQISITVAGDTSGTWLTTNGIGLQIWFNLGSGSTQLGTAGAWGSTFYYGATSSQSIIATNGATFYITGVQLEVGTNATNFEYRQFGTELALCQRYLCISNYVPGEILHQFIILELLLLLILA